MRRALRISIIAVVILALPAFFLYALVIYPVIRPTLWRWESTSALQNANDEASLRKAVGGLGAFVPLQDGSWIAIRYNDTHAGSNDSLAIARDSAGGWFESTHHYCAELGGFGRWVEAQESGDPLEIEMFEGMTFDNGHGDLRDIYTAPDLASARAALLAAGFKQSD